MSATANSGFQRIITLIISFFTLLSALFNLKEEVVYEQPDLIVGIEARDTTNTDVRIMSFNIRCTNVGTAQWYDRVDIVAKTINDALPDSVGVQEATPEWMAALKLALPLYDYVGVGRDDGDNKGEYSAVFFLRSKYKAVESDTFWLSETPDKPSFGWGAACRRVCTWVILENRDTGKQYMHINSHFDHISSAARENSVKMILELAGKHTDIPVTFTADMNIGQDSALYNQVEDSGILHDSKFLSADTMDYRTFHNLSPSADSGSVIDYVFVNDKFAPKVYKVITEGIDGRYVSDHFPIYSDMSFNQN